MAVAEKESWTINEIRQRYDVSMNTVYGWMRSGDLVALDVSLQPGVGKARWRFTKEALERFESLRTTGPKLPKAKRRKAQGNGDVDFFA